MHASARHHANASTGLRRLVHHALEGQRSIERRVVLDDQSRALHRHDAVRDAEPLAPELSIVLEGVALPGFLREKTLRARESTLSVLVLLCSAVQVLQEVQSEVQQDARCEQVQTVLVVRATLDENAEALRVLQGCVEVVLDGQRRCDR